MRTLLILGGLVVCVLLVTPSNGDRTECQDGGENCSGKDPISRLPSNDITTIDEKSMDSEDLTVPAELPCCGWPIRGPCQLCSGKDPIFRLPSNDITTIDEKSVDSGDLTVAAGPRAIPIMETTTELPCCEWLIKPTCKVCPGGFPGIISADDQKKSMDSGNLTVPAEPSEGNVEQLLCCGWPIKPPCKLCLGPFPRLPSHDITADDEKSMDSGNLTVPAEPSKIPIMETTTELPCCRWPRRVPCQVCSGPFPRLPSHDITADDEKLMDSGNLTVPAEPSEIPIMETTTELPCCGWPRREPCQNCRRGGSGISSFDDITTHDEKSMDSGDLTVPAEPSEIPIMETTKELPCCRWPLRPPCKRCPGTGGPFEGSLSHNINADDEKSMDSGNLTVPAEPSKIPIMETTTELPCCGWPRREPCQVCRRGGSGISSFDDITAHDEKSMDSGDLTVPAEPREILIMETTTKLPCCRWPRRVPCEVCYGWGGPFPMPPSHDITADDEKSMDSGDLTVAAGPRAIPIMETTTELPCCGWPIIKNCKKCPGIDSPIDEKPGNLEKDSMDSGDLTVPAEPSEIPIMETTKKLPCCRWPRRVPCKVCPRWGPDIDDER
ncbi:uncharacterized protein LOC143997805 isoform X3 [Lithobates pipiens]